MNNELISVVVPCYNVEKYVEKCIDSILNQTYKNLEILLIDDGSTDTTGKICDKYSLIDNRIIVIHKKNGGLSDARNNGIKKAKGKYIFLLDSDDFINKKAIEFLHRDIISNNADISTCTHINFFEGDSSEIIDESSNINILCDTQDALKYLLYEKGVSTSAWGKLYKKELFNGIQYPKGKICEDLPTTYLLFSKAKLVSINSIQLYFYLIRKDSIIHSKFNSKRLDALDFAKEETRYIKEYFPNILNAAISREFMESVYIASVIPYERIYKTYRKKIKYIFKKYRKIILKDNFINKNEKIYAYMSYFGIFGIKIVYNIKKILDYFNLRRNHEKSKV